MCRVSPALVNHQAPPDRRADGQHRVRSIAFGLLLCLLAFQMIVPTTAHALTRSKGGRIKLDDVLVPKLAQVKPEWNHALANTFIKRMPRKVLEPLRYQTVKTLESYVACRKLPLGRSHGGWKRVCWASSVRGGSYLAIISERSGSFTTVWDTLVPPGFLMPTIQFQDVDGDSIEEFLISGQILDSEEREWTIGRWNGQEGQILAPRLDVKAPTRMHNRLRGRSLQFRYEKGSPTARLVFEVDCDFEGLPTPDGDSTCERVFLYDPDLDGYLPEE